ncbi:MAG: hypothetical protein U0Q12_23940 [Vicinamibacterales bacterium]
MFMRVGVRRQFVLLKLWAIVSSGATVLAAVSGFTQVPSQRFEEITVERLNVVDADGTLRVVLSNKDRMHPGVMDGKTINRPRPVAGMLFFNDEGDEVGGLVVSGQLKNGERRASALLAFDQLKQDQTVGISYDESGGQRTAGLQVWDRSEKPLSELIDKLNAANALSDPTARDAALKAARAGAPPGPRRVFVGKAADRAATVSLSDASGRPRLTLKVEPDGGAAIEFLDETGRVTQRLPAR